MIFNRNPDIFNSTPTIIHIITHPHIHKTNNVIQKLYYQTLYKNVHCVINILLITKTFINIHSAYQSQD